MSEFNQDKYEFLGKQGFTGSIDDRFMQLVQTTTGRRNASERDYWRSFIPTNNGSLNDVKRAFFHTQGHLVPYYGGSITEMEAAHWATLNA